MNGAPKHVENVASGSVTPFSVPATLAVYPDRKWNIACAALNLAIGGITPNASAVSMVRLCGRAVRPGFEALGMKCRGYAALVFSVFEPSSKSQTRVAGSETTFSSTLPQRCGVA